jgi:hypothetical protein
LVGLASFLAGVGLWSIPAALISLGILCFCAVLMIERAKSGKEGKTDGPAQQ